MRSKKLVALSLAWHTLRSSCRQPDVRTVERLRSFEYPVQHIHVIQRFAGDFFCCKQPEKCIQLGLVSGRRYHRHDIRFLPDSLSITQYGSYSFHYCILADVPGLLICRLCHGSEKIWYKRLGLVYCFRHIGRNLFAHHLMATGNRRPLCSLHDFIRIPDYRILPHHVVI